MLNTAKIVGFIPARDLEKAKSFFSTKLGLRMIREDSFAVTFDANGTMLRIARVQEFIPHPFTILGWEVAGIREAVTELAQRGIEFERFGGLPQDDLGIWTSPNGAKVAWFKDPEGNVLSLTQFAAES